MLFRREFAGNAKSLIIWSLIIGGYAFLLLANFQQMADALKAKKELLDAYPEGIKKAFGMDELDLTTLVGFYGVQIYLMTTLLGSIFAAMLAANIIAKEETDKTIEFLLSKPLTRTQIITQKLLAVIVNILILNAFVTGLSLIAFQFAKEEVDIKPFTLLIIATVLLHLTFATISFALSALMKKTRSIVSISLGIVLGSYFLNIMSGVTEDLEDFKYLSFFKYVDAADIVKNNAIDALYVWIMVAVILVSVIFAYVYYQKKDIAV
ncbi:ABC transporter permease subunit [Laceyella putida]|uniref:ABC transporter permease subunit n=1 Tax=Laceyella putida TaxID=110101 RepID=A0ABW2RQ97_9BACL